MPKGKQFKEKTKTVVGEGEKLHFGGVEGEFGEFGFVCGEN